MITPMEMPEWYLVGQIMGEVVSKDGPYTLEACKEYAVMSALQFVLKLGSFEYFNYGDLVLHRDAFTVTCKTNSIY